MGQKFSFAGTQNEQQQNKGSEYAFEVESENMQEEARKHRNGAAV